VLLSRPVQGLRHACPLTHPDQPVVIGCTGVTLD